MNNFRFFFRSLIVFFLASGFGAAPLRAWGCRGHQAIALIAEKHLNPETRKFLETLLRENPVDPQLNRYCGGPDFGLLAAASTWPDDIRRQRPDTAPWHYINIPRGATHKPLEEFCGDRGCITRAIIGQLAVLQDKSADAAKRAEALRFIIHFVGDLHMPLHAADNNDLGGNCVPVNYFHRRPSEHNHSFAPNLHSLWDVAILERDMEGAEPPEYAAYLDDLFSAKVDTWRKAGVHIDDWAWESHDLAESVAYGELVPKISVESPVATRSCTDANQVGERMLALHLTAAEAYQSSAAPVVEQRIAQAGVRLALILNDLFKALSTPAPPSQ